MYTLEEAINFLKQENSGEILSKGMHGLERESLRVNQDGSLALTEHPKHISDSLTDEHITTDFSESQLELITNPHTKIEGALQELEEIHKRVVSGLGNERMWPFSMPAALPEHDDIPIAKYGDSPEAKKKEIYRKGLAMRYGKYMQMLCGIHYNFNFAPEFLETLRQKFAPDIESQDFINDRYLATVRTFILWRWLLVYLFGGSPRCHSSYKCTALKKKNEAVSLRLSRCGYANPAKIHISYNDFQRHLSDIQEAVDTPYKPYTDLGLEKDGEPIQLSDHLLQIPAEYYFPIRLKPKEETDNMLTDLKQNGVRYIEVRIIDVNPMSPIGIDGNQLQFLHVFLAACLLENTGEVSSGDVSRTTAKQEDIALNGRELSDKDLDEATGIFEKLMRVAELMGDEYVAVVMSYSSQLENPKSLPWARMVKEMEEMGGDDFLEYGLKKAEEYNDYFLNQ